jgi:cysteine-S-conjugate beta-lyase
MFDFDEIIDRRRTHSSKWDLMEALFGVSPEDGLSMWTADMDFRAPPAVNAVLADAMRHGIHGYFCDETEHKAAICGWMARRHGWVVDPDWIATTYGVVPGAFVHCLNAFSAPGDGVILFTPVYHAFERVLRANDRRVVEAPLVTVDGRYRMDLEALAPRLDGSERIAVLCSPHNPGGTLWTREEQRALAAFCAAHDLILVADEIHHDLVMPGRRHVPTAVALGDRLDRLVVLTACSKTFNLAGALIGNAIIPDPALRARFEKVHKAAGTGLNGLAVRMATAVYAEGDAWLDALLPYLAENVRIFEAGMAAIPGARPMPLDATYLAWIDFAGTGMTATEFDARVREGARIAPSPGAQFGTGGETFLRFNVATPRARVTEAVERLQAAFADLQ